MAKGMVLTKNKEGEVGRFDDDHPAAQLASHVAELGGEIAPRSMGFKMTDENGGRLGFCVPRKENYVVYLTTIPHDAALLKEFDLDVGKGSGGLAIIKELGLPKKAVKTLKAIYAAADAAKPEKPPKKAKAKAKAEDSAAKKAKKEKKAKKAKAEAAADSDEKTTVRRKKRRSKTVESNGDED